MGPLLLADAALRLLATGQLLLIALVIGRGTAPRTIRIATALLLAGVCCYLTLATPFLARPIRTAWLPVQLGAQSVPVTLWIFAHLLFERPIDRRTAIAGAAACFVVWLFFALPSFAPPAVQMAVRQVGRLIWLGFAIHALIIAISERGDDLIEKRRRLRVGFVIVIATLAVVVIVLEIAFGFRGVPLLSIAQSAAILAATSAMGAALLQSDPELLFDPAAPAPPPAPALSPAESVLKAKLDAAMAGGVYRTTALSIGQLADQLGVPEHRLRLLINQRLGYRNFSAFLNEARIAEAKRQLADPACVALPILTIAMDLGYGSLAPFNRAFREATGQAPGDWRRAAFAEKS
ncbi:AraC family transcriptional regulator [Sphingomonas sp.]|uniref:helix-turn-helix domain-containing protein n=1 Tax=Sphingomonas sp. TaxID=28214 RepID=UPI001D7B4BD0|nr:helix-turn-helix domain-containing protein [Sphingomonas sp.]MBX9795967.1 helix-turn-helix domain-containing protein [Sphingomonas sp.]